MHLQCSRMPAKVYYELSRRFGTRNVLTRTQGWIYWGDAGGVHPLALARELAEHPPPPPYQIMLDPSLQEHYKTKMIQQEHHETEYHLFEVMAGISFCK